MRPKSRSRVVSALPGRCFRGTRRPAAAGDGRPGPVPRARAGTGIPLAYAKFGLGAVTLGGCLIGACFGSANRLVPIDFRICNSKAFVLLLNDKTLILHCLALLLLSKRRQKGQNLTIDRVWVKKEVKRGQNLTLDRVWFKKEVKMGQKSYQKEVLPNMGQNGRSKRVKDLRELLMLRGNT